MIVACNRRRSGNEACQICSGRRKGKALNGLNVPREQVTGVIDVARSQGLQNQAVILIGARSPARRSRHREHQSRIGKLQSIEAREQTRHSARRDQGLVKGAVGHLKLLDRLCIVSFD